MMNVRGYADSFGHLTSAYFLTHYTFSTKSDKKPLLLQYGWNRKDKG